MHPTSVIEIEVGSNNSSFENDQLFNAKYFVVESIDGSGNSCLILQSHRAGEGEVRGQLTLHSNRIDFEGSIRSFGVRPSRPADHSWKFRRARITDSSYETGEETDPDLAYAAHFTMASKPNFVPSDVQVGSSLPNAEESEIVDDWKDKVNGSTSHSDRGTPRLAHKFKRDTVVETPATASRIRTVDGTTLEEMQETPSKASDLPGTSLAPDTAGDGAELVNNDPFSLRHPDANDDVTLFADGLINFSPVKDEPDRTTDLESVESQYVTAKQFPANQVMPPTTSKGNAKEKEASSMVHNDNLHVGCEKPLVNKPVKATKQPSHLSIDGGQRASTEPSMSQKREHSAKEELIEDEPERKKLKTVEDDCKEDTAVRPSPRRGRPRKNTVATVVETGTPGSTSPKSGRRGRPPKVSEGSTPVTPTPLSSNKTAAKRGSLLKAGTESVEPVDAADTTPRRSSRRSSHMASPSVVAPKNHTRVLLSNTSVADRAAILNKFIKLGPVIGQSQNLDTFDVLVIGTGEMKRTAKLLLAVATGKPVALDTWITESIRADRLLSLDKYLPAKQANWGYDPAKINSRKDLLAGKTLHVTPALKRYWGVDAYRDIEKLALAMGAEKVMSRTARGLKNDGNTIVIGQEKDDPDSKAVLDNESVCYNRDFLSFVALRGHLDLDSDEFRIKSEASRGKRPKRGKVSENIESEAKSKRGRPRKNI